VIAAVGEIATLVAIDQELLSLKLTHEPAVTSLRTGRRLLSLAGQLTADYAVQAYAAEVKAGDTPGCYPVCLGALGAAWGLDPEQIALVDLYSFVSGLLGVETGACQHTAVREDPTMNLAAIEEMQTLFPDSALVLLESGGGIAEVAETIGREILGAGPAGETHRAWADLDHHA
jgi:hypothetical protein